MALGSENTIPTHTVWCNGNENIISQNLWDTAKVVLRVKSETKKGSNSKYQGNPGNHQG
jgi:hypothetical protein